MPLAHTSTRIPGRAAPEGRTSVTPREVAAGTVAALEAEHLTLRDPVGEAPGS